MKFYTKKVIKTALAVALASSMFATTASANGSTFSDVPKTNVHYDEIYNLAGRDIVTGYPDGTYRPAGHLTRAEASVILAKALQLDTSEYADPEFTDLKKGAWYYDEVAALTELGILNGYGNGKFGPNDKLTRSQMASILTFAYNLYAPSTTQLPFTDVASTSWYFPYVQGLYFYDVTAGTTKTTYSPNAFVRRDAMASFVVNAEEADVELKVDTQLAMGIEEFNNSAGIPVKAEFNPETNEVTITIFDTYVPAAESRPLQLRDIANTGLFSKIPYNDLQTAYAGNSTVELTSVSPSVARATVIGELGLTEDSPATDLVDKELTFTLTDYFDNVIEYTFKFDSFQ